MKRSGILTGLVLLCIVGCHTKMSTGELQVKVRQSISETLATNESNATVVSLALTQQKDNNYDGVLEYAQEGMKGSIPVNVTYDGKDIAWKLVGSLRKPTSALAKEVQDSIAAKLAGDPATAAAKVEKLSLVYKAGNEYTGILDLSADDEKVSKTVEVTYDGTTFMWKMVN